VVWGHCCLLLDKDLQAENDILFRAKCWGNDMRGGPHLLGDVCPQNQASKYRDHGTFVGVWKIGQLWWGMRVCTRGVSSKVHNPFCTLPWDLHLACCQFWTLKKVVTKIQGYHKLVESFHGTCLSPNNGQALITIAHMLHLEVQLYDHWSLITIAYVALRSPALWSLITDHYSICCT